MAKSLETQVSFSGGEWSPQMDARIDHPKYKHACRKMRNVIPLKNGGATRRPGTRFIGPTGAETREISFQYSTTTSFVLAFSDEEIRFFSNRYAVTLSLSDVNAWVSGQPYLPYQYVKSFGTIYRCILSVTSVTPPASDPTHWIADPTYVIESPYRSTNYITNLYDADVWTITPCQINDVVYLASPRFPTYSLTRISDINWVIEQVEFLVPPLLDQNITSTTIAASATTGTGITLTASAPAWITAKYYVPSNSVLQGGLIYACKVPHTSGTFAIDLAAGKWEQQFPFHSTNAIIGSTYQLSYLKNADYVNYDITANGSSVSILTLGAWEAQTMGVWVGDMTVQRSFDGGTTWDDVQVITSRSDNNNTIAGNSTKLALYRVTITNYAVPAVPGANTPRVVFSVLNAFVRGLVKITGWTSSVSVTANVITDLDSTSATQYWSEGAWSAVRGYPRAVTTYQQRLVFGGSSYEPQRIWGSVTNDLENFDRGDATKATDSYAFDLAAIGRGPIQWLISQSDLFAGFSGAEWIINSGTTATSAITTTSINAVELSSWGSAANVQPYVVGNAVFYTQRQARTIQQMLFSVYTNKYMSSDMTALSEHLFTDGIAQIAYQPRFNNQGMIWIVTKAGALLSMTYSLEQEVFAWARHDTVSGDLFESVACIQGSGIDDDEVWVVARRNVLVSGVMTQVRYVELIDPVLTDDFVSSYVDSARHQTGTLSNVIGSLSHLEGKSVVGVIGGNISFGPLTVSGGAVTIPNYVANGETVYVGLPISYELQPMRLDSDARIGGTQGLVKNISDIYLRILNSIGGKISDGTDETPIEYRPNDMPLDQYPTPFTGEKRIQPFSDYSTDPVYIIKGDDALPLTVLAIIVKYDLSGKP